MMTSGVASLKASDAAFRWMSVANARMSMLSCCGQPSFKGRNDADVNLQLDMLNASTQYKANMLMADTFEKVKKDNLKRSLTMFQD